MMRIEIKRTDKWNRKVEISIEEASGDVATTNNKSKDVHKVYRA